ncbi:X2-like carbohydrate binding domain-containing protein [Paenibacillus mesophilus]|uniref:X2-like carbohydrate binding domain-containing protein n=1 Tax=Paenibacillus mesophilus TaxID=2582849 RepID=UPI0013050F99|nr:X2-like carbohydrate binding domain-containing protein [Paenibacillus mesophilus]
MKTARIMTRGMARIISVFLCCVLVVQVCTATRIYAAEGGTSNPSTVTPINTTGEKSKDDYLFNGTISVYYLNQGNWVLQGSILYDEFVTAASLPIAGLQANEPVTLKLVKSGGGNANLDAVLLDSLAPVEVTGEDGKALAKVSSQDLDLLNMKSDGTTIVFGGGAAAGMLTIAARIEPDPISQIPFRFPVASAGESEAYYDYTLDSQRGTIVLDGKLDEVAAMPLFMKEFARPATGHPSNYLHTWVFNDDDYLYVTMDVTPDNTMDDWKDYAKVYVKTAAGVQEYRLSLYETAWGQTSFVYTEHAVYEHKLYEFKIPLSALNSGSNWLQMAFEFYGTSASGAFDDSYSTDKNTQLSVVAPGVLSNDTFGYPSAWTTVLVSQALHGTASLQPNGSFTYTPDTDYVGTDVFTYRITDGVWPSNAASVTITVKAPNEISPANASFDKKTSAQADVTVTLAPSGNTVTGIVYGLTPLVSGADYTVSGSTVTIKKEFLARQPVGTTSLTFVFNAGAPQTLTVGIVDTTIQNSVISPTNASFDKKTSAQADVTTTLTLNGNTVTGIVYGLTSLISGTDYSISGNTVTIKKEYLAQQAVGVANLTFVFSAGAPQTLSIAISDTTPLNSTISPTNASFDKKTSAQADVTTTLTLNGNTLSGIVNGLQSLVAGTDYTVSGNTVTIKKEYLAQQLVGTTNLTFVFSAGAPQTLSIGIVDTTPQNSAISPTNASFDKKTSAQADVTTTLTTNGNTLSGIVNGLQSLVAGTDYMVSGNTVTIKKEYLAQQWVGTTNLTFVFSAGAPQTLSIVIVDTTPLNSTISPTSASFDKKTSAQADVATTLALNGNTLSGIVNGLQSLVVGTDYTVSGNTVTIKKEYLAKQTVGMANLTFVFSAGAPQTLSIAIVDTTPTPVIPGAPVLQLPVEGNAQVTLTWSPVNGSTHYTVFQSVTAGTYGTEAATVSGSVYSYTVTGLTNGTTYYFVVKSVNDSVYGPASNQVSAMPKTIPAAPTDVTATAGNRQATVSFTAPSDNGGSAITGYVVTASTGDITATGTTSPITVTGLWNGTAYTFTVKAINSVGAGAPSAESNVVVPRAPSDFGSSTSAPPANTGIEVLVNGRAENAGTATTTQVNDRTVTTISVDPKKLEDRLAAEGQGSIITIPVNTKSDVVIGELNGQMVKNMEQKQAVVELRTEKASYKLPAEQINMNAILDQLGGIVALQDIKVQIEIAAPAAETVKVVENAASAGGFTLVVPPVNFTVRGIYGDKTIEISRFNAYVERTVAIPDGVDPAKITTGVVIEPDGTVRHVPTKIIVIDGKYYARVNSLTNSTYSIVWHPREFKDTAGHWAKEAVNNMGSRMVVGGIGNDLFNPDQPVTRAEFAAIITRGLGLKLASGAASFADVKATDWYGSAVQTAYAYNLIDGFEDGSFRPMDMITREQAMTIIARAMTITGLTAKLPSKAAGNVLSSFADANEAAGWAKSAIAECVQAAIVSGRTGTELAPKGNMTRAEIAVIVERLLQKSELI